MQAAATLGFDAVQWDNGMTPDSSAVPWSALPPQLRSAAAVLGYTSPVWNEDGGFPMALAGLSGDEQSFGTAESLISPGR